MKFPIKIPGQIYLWIAVIMFAASNSIVRKLSDIGAQHLVEGRNPISFCNVLFVSNLCALLVLIPGFYRQLSWQNFRQISRQEWFSLVIMAILSGALVPAFIFTALSETMVSNVIIIGRVEPPLILALSFWLLGARLHRLEVIGTFVSFVFFVLANLLYSSHHFAEAFSPFLWQWMLLYGIVIVAVGQFCLFKGLKAVTISEASLINSFSPVAGIIAAALILGEKLTIAHYIGGIVIIAGLLLTQIGIWQKNSPKKPISKVVSVNQMEAKIGFKGI